MQNHLSARTIESIKDVVRFFVGYKDETYRQHLINIGLKTGTIAEWLDFLQTPGWINVELDEFQLYGLRVVGVGEIITLSNPTIRLADRPCVRLLTAALGIRDGKANDDLLVCNNRSFISLLQTVPDIFTMLVPDKTASDQGVFRNIMADAMNMAAEVRANPNFWAVLPFSKNKDWIVAKKIGLVIISDGLNPDSWTPKKVRHNAVARAVIDMVGMRRLIEICTVTIPRSADLFDSISGPVMDLADEISQMNL